MLGDIIYTVVSLVLTLLSIVGLVAIWFIWALITAPTVDDYVKIERKNKGKKK